MTVITGAGGWLGTGLVSAFLDPDHPWSPTEERSGCSSATATTRRASPRLSDRVEVVVGDISDRRRRRSPVRRSDGHRRRDPHGRRHPPDGDVRLRRGQPRRRGQRAGRRRGVRRPANGARVVEQPVRHQPVPQRHVPQRRAVPPVPRVRQLEDAGRTARGRGRRARTERRDGAPAVVLRAAPAGASDDVLHARAHRSLPRARRRRSASLDGVHRQPGPGHRAGRADRDRSPAWAGGSPTTTPTR